MWIKTVQDAVWGYTEKMIQKFNIKKSFIFSLIAIGFLIASSFSGAFAVVYTWTAQTASGIHDWQSIAASSDGVKLAAVVNGGYIYTSIDSGVTWTEQTSTGSRGWDGITSSSDGAKLAAIAYNGYVYTSTDSGVTWTEQTSAGSRLWTSITSSADGAKIFAGTTYGYIYTSTDSGVTWTEQTSAGSRGWISLASSADGTKLVAAAYTGYIYTSTDSGATWTEQTGSGQRGWFSVTSSSDGTKLAAVASFNDYVYTSTDSGVTWTLHITSGAHDWRSIASSADGSKLVAGVYADHVYISTDSGATWAQRTGPTTRQWQTVASSSDGTKLVAGATGDYIYTATPDIVTGTPDVTAPTLTSFTSTTANGYYGAGSIINVTARFNETLGATSTMTVVLDTGVSVTLNNISGATLAGTYIVTSGETSPDLTVSSITSASVSDASLNNRTTYSVPVAPNNIANVKAIVVDTSAPILTSFTSTTPNGHYGPGAIINITARFNENLAATSTATSTMTVVLDTGVAVFLDTVSGKNLSGTYTVLPGDTSPDLTVTSITSASVYDRARNNGTSYIVPAAPNNIANVKAIVIDSVAPTLVSFTSTTANGSYASGSTVNIRAKFNETLGVGSTMTVILDTGTSVVLNAVSSTTLNGTYTILAGETSSDLTVASITSASVNDVALNNATSFTVPAAPNNIANVKNIRVN